MSAQAGTLFFYNAWRAKLDANYDSSSDTFKVMLVESGYTPDLNHSNTSEVSDEVTGYTQQTCLNVKFEIINALHNFDCDNVVFSPSAVITPRRFVVYKENGIVQELVCFGLLNSADQDVSVGVGGKLTINFGLFGATGAQGNATPHNHTESDIVGLDKYTQAEVDSRIQAITDLLTSDDTNLDDLQEIVDYIQLNRSDLSNLSIPAIAGLQLVLDSKAPIAHTHLISEINGLTSALLNYIPYNGASQDVDLGANNLALEGVITTTGNDTPNQSRIGEGLVVNDNQNSTVGDFVVKTTLNANALRVSTEELTLNIPIKANQGISTKYSEETVATPPTEANLNTAFPSATQGFVGILNNGGNDTEVYSCIKTANKWHYTQLSEAL